jgi:hypothetical protein
MLSAAFGRNDVLKPNPQTRLSAWLYSLMKRGGLMRQSLTPHFQVFVRTHNLNSGFLIHPTLWDSSAL